MNAARDIPARIAGKGGRQSAVPAQVSPSVGAELEESRSMPTSALARRRRPVVGICLRQIVRPGRTGRSMIAPTAWYGGGYDGGTAGLRRGYGGASRTPPPTSSFPVPCPLFPVLCRVASNARRYGRVCSLFPVPRSLFPVPRSLFPVPCSLFPVPRSLFPVPCSLFPVPSCSS